MSYEPAGVVVAVKAAMTGRSLDSPANEGWLEEGRVIPPPLGICELHPLHQTDL